MKASFRVQHLKNAMFACSLAGCGVLPARVGEKKFGNILCGKIGFSDFDVYCPQPDLVLSRRLPFHQSEPG